MGRSPGDEPREEAESAAAVSGLPIVAMGVAVTVAVAVAVVV